MHPCRTFFGSAITAEDQFKHDSESQVAQDLIEERILTEQHVTADFMGLRPIHSPKFWMTATPTCQTALTHVPPTSGYSGNFKT